MPASFLHHIFRLPTFINPSILIGAKQWVGVLF